jgi:MFS family permease
MKIFRRSRDRRPRWVRRAPRRPTRYIMTNRAPPEQRASAVGMLIVGQIVGGSLGGGVAESHGAVINGYRMAYLIFAGIAVVSRDVNCRARFATARASTYSSR